MPFAQDASLAWPMPLILLLATLVEVDHLYQIL